MTRSSASLVQWFSGSVLLLPVATISRRRASDPRLLYTCSAECERDPQPRRDLRGTLPAGRIRIHPGTAPARVSACLAAPPNIRTAWHSGSRWRRDHALFRARHGTAVPPPGTRFYSDSSSFTLRCTLRTLRGCPIGATRNRRPAANAADRSNNASNRTICQCHYPTQPAVCPWS